MRTLTILGSTGSIGKSALRVVDALAGEYRVTGLSCGLNTPDLDEQIARYKPETVAVAGASDLPLDVIHALRKKYPEVEILEGNEGVAELASRKVDVVLSSIVGAAGLIPSLCAIGKAGRIALANKETLVMAGDLFMERIRSSSTELIPVDSEHSALFCLLEGIDRLELERVIITASGGSLRELPVSELGRVTPEQALRHPNWSMGSKITIDSATLINKGLEVMEAHHLFSLDYSNIDVVVHRESVIHAMAETVDGALYAHMGVADMALPIINALTHPAKVKNPFGRMDLARIGSLHFSEVDHERYPALSLCYHAGKSGGTAPAVLNAANEVAVAAFLEGRIRFTDIVPVVEKTLEHHDIICNPSLESILTCDGDARSCAKRIIRGDM